MLSKLWQNTVLATKIKKTPYLVHIIAALVVLVGVYGIAGSSLIDWDEGVFALQGEWLATQGSLGKPYNFQTPPLFPSLLALLFTVFGIKPIVLAYVSLVCSCITLYIVFLTADMLYSREEGVYSVAIFASTELFLFLSRSGLSDATFVCFFMACIFFFLKGIKYNQTKDFILAGLCTAIALYTKYSALSLLVIFLVIGMLHRKALPKSWSLSSIVAPILLLLPYALLMIAVVHVPEIRARHLSLLGINHLKFLLYLIIYTPVPFVLAIGYVVIQRRKLTVWDSYLCIIVLVFLACLGFYHPYFRLVYPLVPIVSILSSHLVAKLGKFKLYILAVSVSISLLLSSGTLSYRSRVPAYVGRVAKTYAQQENIRYIYALVPPNIVFYIDGMIAVPENHPWFTMGKRFPQLLKHKTILLPHTNLLRSEEKALLIHATALDSIKQMYTELYNQGTILDRVEFIDAPVYYKDIYNPQRNKQQVYEFYLFETKELGQKIDDLWNLGFDRQVTVIIRY